MSEPVENRESDLFGGGKQVAPPKPPSLAEQFMGVFTDPIPLFKRLNATPSWAWALAAVILSSLVLAIIWGFKVDVDAMLRPVLERNPQLSAAQVEQSIEMGGKFVVPATLVMVPIGGILMTLFVALIYWVVGLATAEEGKPSYLLALSATAVPGLVRVPHALFSAAMCLLKPVGGLSMEKLSPTALGFYLRPENPKLYALFCQLDLFMIAGCVLGYLALRHVMRMKVIGAALCTAIGVVLLLGTTVLFAK
jgi:hypothetical protein